MDKKIKVLLVSPFSAKKVGGIGTWTKSVLDYRESDEHTKIVFQNTAFELKRLIKGSKIRRIVIGSIDSLLILVKLFFNMIIHNPDVVHYTSSAGFGLFKDKLAIILVKKIFKKKFVIHWHFGRIPEMFAQKTSEYDRLKSVHKLSDASIVLDKRSKEVMILDDLSNVYSVPNAVTQAVFEFGQSLDIEKNQCERLYNEVLYVGHIIPAKGIYELVKACVSIDNLHLTMVGPDMSNNVVNLRKIAKLRDNGDWLTFTGELDREKVLPLYQKCSLFCLPSYTEGFPYVILESMSCGCPIVATSVGAIPEILSDNCGRIVERQNVDQLKESIEEMINNRDNSLKMGSRAYHKVIKDYSIETVFSLYKDIWNKVVWGS